MTADVQVLRLFAASGEPLALDRIQVRFLAYGPSVTQFVNGYPPPLPSLKPGDVLVFPLLENQNPASEWKLTADSGADLVVPALAEIAKSEPLPTTARAFLDREIANTLSLG